ncbi:MAG: Peptidoglycan glycosyltransferase [Firmicutes bacterium]|nr:Peptidoglycan glycosyltransferase [Bacillota bacterium]
MMRNDMSDIVSNIRKVAFCLLGLLVILFIYLSYIQVVESNFLVSHPLNRRNAESTRHVKNGMIVDKNGEKLAYSEKSRDGFKRQYPYGSITANVVGYDSYQYGKTGIESTFNTYLTGMNNPLRHLGAISHLWSDLPGNNVLLTLDAKLQETAYRELGENRGAIVVMVPRTGAILAMVSKPSFNPNTLDSQWESISTASNSPLLNRAVQGLYPPGSIIKVMMADAALTENIVDLKTTINCDGALKVPPDYILAESGLKAHGRVNLEEALAVSCNVTFGSLALRLGGGKMAKTFDRYGFKLPVGEELQEAKLRLPDFNSLGNGDLAQVGIGQGSLLVTPLRMAMLASAFANKGKIIKPNIVTKITDSDGNVIKEFMPEEWITPTSPQLADAIKEMMVTVVNDGTGNGAYLSGTRVAGKTGTAENPHGASHAWFIGFAPADNPEVAIAVIVENAGSGGSIAAPIAGRILAKALH